MDVGRESLGIRFSKFDGHPRAFVSGMRVDAGDISVPGFHFHPSVVSRKATLPTLTTPAPTAA
eukprot:12771715-Heterocapsa_arctica.AAC.1